VEEEELCLQVKAQRCGRTCHADGLGSQNPFGCMINVAKGRCWVVERYLDKFIEIFVQLTKPTLVQRLTFQLQRAGVTNKCLWSPQPSSHLSNVF
jgi:hypothetical protein